MAFGMFNKAFPRQPVGGTHGSAINADGPLTLSVALSVCVSRSEGLDIPPSSGVPVLGPGHSTGADAFA